MTRASPYQAFNFVVVLSGVEVGGFTEVSGLSLSMDITDDRAGRSLKSPVRKVLTMHKSGDVTLKRGIVSSGDFSAWITSSGKQAPRDLTLLLKDEKGAPVHRWALSRATPLKSTGPTLSAKGNDVAMEELVLSCETIESS